MPDSTSLYLNDDEEEPHDIEVVVLSSSDDEDAAPCPECDAAHAQAVRETVRAVEAALREHSTACEPRVRVRVDAEDAQDGISFAPLQHDDVAFVLNDEWRRPLHERTLRSLLRAAQSHGKAVESPWTRESVRYVTRVRVCLQQQQQQAPATAPTASAPLKRPRTDSG